MRKSKERSSHQWWSREERRRAWKVGLEGTTVGSHHLKKYTAYYNHQEPQLNHLEMHWRKKTPDDTTFIGCEFKWDLISRRWVFGRSRWLQIAEEKSGWLQMRDCSSLAIWVGSVLRVQLSPVWFGQELPVWHFLLCCQLAGESSDLAPGYSSPQLGPLGGTLLPRGCFPRLGRLMSPSRRGWYYPLPGRPSSPAFIPVTTLDAPLVYTRLDESCLLIVGCLLLERFAALQHWLLAMTNCRLQAGPWGKTRIALTVVASGWRCIQEKVAPAKFTGCRYDGIATKLPISTIMRMQKLHQKLQKK